MKVIGVLLFEGYETLDAHGPIQFLGGRPDTKLITICENKGVIRSRQGVAVDPDYDFANCPALNVLLVPGGFGVRRELSNECLLAWLRDTYCNPDKPLAYLLSVCTGSWLLAKAGLLDGKKATSNKLSWEGALAVSDKPVWIKHARWVHDGNIITASGVSAGVDMTLYFIALTMGSEVAQQSAKYAEYNGQWTDPTDDPWS